MEKEANKWIALKRGEYFVTINNKNFRIYIEDRTSITVDGSTYKIDLQKIKDDVYSLNLLNSNYKITFSEVWDNTPQTTSAKLSSKFCIHVNGTMIQTVVDDQRSLVAQSWMQRKPHNSKASLLRAPMPGLITKVIVRQGEIVQRGSVLLVLEAMKMENEIRALQQCKIELVLIQPGTTVERNDELLRIIEI